MRNGSIAKPAGYIPSLDGLRAFSILIVFCAHAFRSIPIPGGFGVTVFFFISGYLISTLLCRELASTSSIDLRAFYKRRFFRLAPPLLITLFFGVLMVVGGFLDGTLNPIGLVSQIFFFFNYWDAYANQGDVIYGTKIFWSLAVEEHFYFIFPLALLFLFRKNLSYHWITVLAFAVLFWRSFKFLMLWANEWQIYSLTDTRFDSMLWGCLLSLMAFENRGRLDRLSPKMWKIVALACGFGILATFIVRDEVFRSTWRYTLQGIMLFPIFFVALNFDDSWLYKLLNWQPLTKIGFYSYTFYLSHYIILGLLHQNFSALSEIWIGVISGIVAISYSALVYRFVEQPIRRWRSANLAGQ